MRMHYTECDVLECTERTENHRGRGSDINEIAGLPEGWSFSVIEIKGSNGGSKERKGYLCPAHTQQIEAVLGPVCDHPNGVTEGNVVHCPDCGVSYGVVSGP